MCSKCARALVGCDDNMNRELTQHESGGSENVIK